MKQNLSGWSSPPPHHEQEFWMKSVFVICFQGMSMHVLQRNGTEVVYRRLVMGSWLTRLRRLGSSAVCLRPVQAPECRRPGNHRTANKFKGRGRRGGNTSSLLPFSSGQALHGLDGAYARRGGQSTDSSHRLIPNHPEMMFKSGHPMVQSHSHTELTVTIWNTQEMTTCITVSLYYRSMARR